MKLRLLVATLAALAAAAPLLAQTRPPARPSITGS